MNDAIRFGRNILVFALLIMSTACVLEPRNDYYDRDHHRYYHDHAWRDCGERDDHCR